MLKGAGGTEGGVGQFLLGLLMAVGGAYLITNQVSVSSGFWGWFGPHTFGLTLVPARAQFPILGLTRSAVQGT